MVKTLSKKIFFLVPALFLVLYFTPVSACSCVDPQNVSDNLNKSSVVFLGKVTNVEEPTIASKVVDKKVVTLSVSRIWKGNLDKTVTVYTSMDDASCGFNFQKNAEYLVYADNSTNGYDVNICSRTKTSSSAVEDFTQLGTPIKEITADKNISISVIVAYVVIFLISFNVSAFAGYFLYKKLKKKNGQQRVS